MMKDSGRTEPSSHPLTRMPQQRDVDRKAKAIFIPTPGLDQTMILPAQSVKTHQLL